MPSEKDHNSSWSVVNNHNRLSQQVIASIMESPDDASGSARSTISNEKLAESASTVPTSNLSATDLTTVVRHMDEKFEMSYCIDFESQDELQCNFGPTYLRLMISMCSGLW
jgi:hypothetical protein